MYIAALVLAPIAILTIASVGVQFSDLQDLDARQSAALQSTILELVEARTGQPGKLISDTCNVTDKACAERLAKGAGVDRLLSVRVIVAITTIGVFLQTEEPGRKAQVEVPVEHDTWANLLRPVMSSLLPAPEKAAEPTPPPTRGAEPKPLPKAEPTPPEGPASPPQPELTTSPNVEPVDTWATASGIAGGALAVAGVSLLISAAIDRSSLNQDLAMVDRNGMVIGVTLDEAESRANSINVRNGVGGALTGVGAGLITFALYRWLSD